jgi:pilus assembly protein TadC
VPRTHVLERLVTSEFEEAIAFLYQNSLRPTHIMGGIVVVSGVSILTTILVLSQFLAIIGALVLGITIGLIACLTFFYNIISKYQKQLLTIEKATPQVLEELATLFLTTGSAFESIEYVSKGDYGPISSAFSKMIVMLNNGLPPEQLLREYATSQPSMTLRRGLLTFIQFIESSATNLEAAINDAHEDLQRKYEGRTIQWESRMMVISGMLVFLPIIFILGVAIRGLGSHPFVLILPIFQFLLSKIMVSKLLPKDLILLGE